MNSNSLENLCKSKPNHVDILRKKAKYLDVRLPSLKDSGAHGRTYAITIESVNADCVKAYETPDKRQLPKFCVERHINPNSSFCLYLNSTKPLLSTTDAELWWWALGKYLSHQDYAEKHGLWPRNQGLSHGDAANTQIEMEELAEPLGWKNEVLDSIFRDRGFLAEAPLRLHSDKRGFVNLRSPCPRKCRKLHFPHQKESCSRDICQPNCKKIHKPILRVSCPNRAVIEKLNLLEIRRQAEERELVLELRRDGLKCCGTMRDCPLASD